ncbi:MAG: Holliday junction resolvase RuvX [Rhodocyclaceae bacterium]|nr:Holliday junction resolvase RuvX [Rhodocyclaceae bacterium]
MGFDFGEKRIGVATVNLSIGLAAPLTTIRAASNADRLAAIAKLFNDWQPAQFVVGQPRHADDQPHEIAHLAKKFGNRLEEKFKRPVVYIDETLSSTEAARLLVERGITGREQKDKLDAFAAAVILQSWMNEYALAVAVNNQTKADHAA